MSEKKFALQTVGDTVVRNNQTNEIYWNHNLVHLINSLSKENEQLKFENETLKSNYQREIQSSIDFCNAYSKTNGELLEEIEKLEKENERLRNQLERKTILLKIRTKHIDDREKSFHELLNYLESFCYKSNIDGNYAKQDIINILNNWEIREYD